MNFKIILSERSQKKGRILPDSIQIKSKRCKVFHSDIKHILCCPRYGEGREGIQSGLRSNDYVYHFETTLYFDWHVVT